MATTRKTILVVDRSADDLRVIDAILTDHHRVRTAQTGGGALAEMRVPPRPDLVLLDVMVPEIDGYEVCRRLKADPATADVPVIFLTAATEAACGVRGLALGGADVVTKPVEPPVVLARVGTHLELSEARRFMHDQIALLDRLVAERTADLVATQDATIYAMASLAETRDHETAHHVRRTQLYVKVLAEALRDHPRFRDTLGGTAIEQLAKSVPLHDIGKVGIPDHILRKPGRLSADEYAWMQRHTRIGRDAIAVAERALGDRRSSFLRFGREVAQSHHERWDGTGYPEGLSGDRIPVAGRLMALADNYDALISRRVYKPAIPHDKVVEMITAQTGTAFDPDVVDAFLTVADRFREIAERYADEGLADGDAS